VANAGFPIRQPALVNLQSGRCVADPSSSTTSGTQLQIWDCYGNDAQHWTLPG
jgi:hypothetical protein